MFTLPRTAEHSAGILECILDVGFRRDIQIRVIRVQEEATARSSNEAYARKNEQIKYTRVKIIHRRNVVVVLLDETLLSKVTLCA